MFDTRSCHTFISPSADSRRAVVSYWRKYVHGVLVNRLGGLSLPSKSLVRLTDCPDMTIDVYCGRKKQHNGITRLYYFICQIPQKNFKHLAKGIYSNNFKQLPRDQANVDVLKNLYGPCYGWVHMLAKLVA